MDMHSSTPGQRLALRMAAWAAGLDSGNEIVAWALLRLDDLALARAPHDLPAFHAHAQRMRNTVVPALTVRQVLELDAILDDRAWRDPEADFHHFCAAYATVRHGERSGLAA